MSGRVTVENGVRDCLPRIQESPVFRWCLVRSCRVLSAEGWRRRSYMIWRLECRCVVRDVSGVLVVVLGIVNVGGVGGSGRFWELKMVVRILSALWRSVWGREVSRIQPFYCWKLLSLRIGIRGSWLWWWNFRLRSRDWSWGFHVVLEISFVAGQVVGAARIVYPSVVAGGGVENLNVGRAAGWGVEGLLSCWAGLWTAGIADSFRRVVFLDAIQWSGRVACGGSSLLSCRTYREVECWRCWSWRTSVMSLKWLLKLSAKLL